MRRSFLTVLILATALISCGGAGGNSAKSAGNGSENESNTKNAGSGEDEKSSVKSDGDNSSSGGNTDWVEINGVKWATRNVGASGTFVATPEDWGEYYRGDSEAQNACPKGWRLPTKAEFQSLKDAGDRWTEDRAVRGYSFGYGDKTIFLPASGEYSDDLGIMQRDFAGSYWTSDFNSRETGKCFYLFFRISGSCIFQSVPPKNAKMSIRCVKMS
jgi:uncharacterized protein (TIGR02145 family)